MSKHGLAIGLAAMLPVLLGGCVNFSKVGPGGKAMMEHHYAGEAGKVVGAMDHTGPQSVEEAPAPEPAPSPAS